jgi:hypothetical protein
MVKNVSVIGLADRRLRLDALEKGDVNEKAGRPF